MIVFQNKKEFEDFWKENQAIIFGICLKCCDYNRDLAEDVYQTTGLKIANQIDKKGSISINIPFAYIKRIIINIIIDISRKNNITQKKAIDPSSDIQISDNRIAENNIISNDLLEALVKHLTATEEAIFRLNLAGYKHQDIANILESTADSIKSTLYKARKKLQSVLTGSDKNKYLTILLLISYLLKI